MAIKTYGTSSAYRRIQLFEKRFGEAHLYLARHAAFPLAITPELMYSIWVNFQRDINGLYFNIPWIAVTDILLSNLCEEVGYELYEMDEEVRSILLEQLKKQPSLGQPRITQLAQFLLDYLQRQLLDDNSEIKDFAKAQKWSALAYTNPHEAARELALELSQINQRSTSELLRITSIVESLAEPLAEFKSLIAYARGMESFARGNLENATKQLAAVVTVNNEIKEAGLNLPIPEEIRTKLPSSITLNKRAVIIVAIVALIGAVGVAALSIFLTREVNQQNLTFGAIELPTTHPLYRTNLATQINQLTDVQPTDWYYQAVQSLTERYAIVYPYEDNTFRPNSKITKAELIDFTSNALIRMHKILQNSLAGAKLCRYIGVPNLKTDFRIPNGINPKDWYYLSYRNLASLIGERLDYSNGQFQGDQPATRYEMVVVLNRAFDGFNELIAVQEYSQNSNSSTGLNSYHATFTFDDNQNSSLKNPTILAQVTSVTQFSDIDNNHWAFQDLQSLVERYGASAGYPNGTFRGNSTFTRGEFAAQLNAGLDRINELLATQTINCTPRSSETQQKRWGNSK